MKKYLIIIFIFLLGASIFIYRSRQSEVIEIDLPEAKEYQEFINNNNQEDVVQEEPVIIENNNTNTSVVVEAEIEVPNNETEEPIVVEVDKPTILASINLSVPFTSQAPTSNWDQPYQDACEEASVLMVDYYYGNKKFPSPESVEVMLSDMVKWEEKNMSGDIDMDIAEVANFSKNYLGYDYKIINNPSIEDIKLYLAKGQPVIVPANGKTLANPYFSNGGPVYHMLVIKGYVDGKFITNDPGTRNGADFIYTYQNLMSSIADWDNKSSSATGIPKALILIKKLSY